MSALLLASFASLAAATPFVGMWNCESAFPSDPFAITLEISGASDMMSAHIRESNDDRLPVGPVRIFGGPERLEFPGDLVPDQRLQGMVENIPGDVSFTMLWDQDDGLSVNLWQYFSDGRASHLLGALECHGGAA